MKSFLLFLMCIVSIQSYSQNVEIGDEFLPINLEGKEACLSTKTGEYVFRSHADTNVSMLKTTESGVIYTDIKIHIVAKRENISKIAKKHGLTQDELMKHNKLSSNKLSIGQELKIIKKIAVKSSSPVISQEESTIIARLNPGQTPTGLDSAPPNRAPMSSTNLPSTKDKNKQVTEHEKKATNYYTVTKGDSLYSIAKKHNITIDSLMKVNNLTSNNLSIGQKLKLK